MTFRQLSSGPRELESTKTDSVRLLVVCIRRLWLGDDASETRKPALSNAKRVCGRYIGSTRLMGQWGFGCLAGSVCQAQR